MQALFIMLLLGFSAPLAAHEPTVLSLPAEVRDGDIVSLDCGRTYVGQLRLTGLREVRVRTRGDCGKAVLTTATPVSGWRRDSTQPSVWVTELGFTPTQVQFGTRFLPPAHHPNVPMDWLHGESRVPDQLRLQQSIPDLAGATLVWRATDWLIETRRIVRQDGRRVWLAPGGEHSLGLPAKTAFYVEGKRCMLDSAGEWVHEAGRLYLWPPGGGVPKQTVWASPAGSAIDARDSVDVRIEGIRIFGATLGIDTRGSRGLQVADAEIDNSGEAAIMAGSELRVVRVAVRGSVQDGLRATDDARDIQVLDSRFEDIGMLGRPRRSRGAIVFEQAQRVIVQRNRIRNAAYIGIRVFRDALVTDNYIERACQRLADCGGIYTFARDRQPLHVRIENNRVSQLGGEFAFAIYLDDFANGVRVAGNQLIDNPAGMQLHNGFANDITRNTFANSQRQHILFNETADSPVITGNRVSRNRFRSVRKVPVYRLWSHHGGKHIGRFAEFYRNHYHGMPTGIAEGEGRGALGWDQWLADFASGDHAPESRRRPVATSNISGGRAPITDRSDGND